MLFNKENKGSEEIKQLVGSYYASNNFDKIKSDIDLAAFELTKVIGAAVYALAEAAYTTTNHAAAALVPYVQLPVAILACLNMYRQNDISHEDTGRKIKIDSTNEKLPWEWQLKRDDEIQMERYYQAVDRLIAYLDSTTLTEWKDSDAKKMSQSLFINNTSRFDFYFPINQSGRMYVLLLPFIREAERKYIKPALGADYQKFLDGEELSEPETDVLELVYPPIPLLAMSIAIRRMPLGLIPAGVVRNFASDKHSADANDPALLSDTKYMSHLLLAEGLELLNDLKKAKSGETVRVLLPPNDANNKYMRV